MKYDALTGHVINPASAENCTSFDTRKRSVKYDLQFPIITKHNILVAFINILFYRCSTVCFRASVNIVHMTF